MKPFLSLMMAVVTMAQSPPVFQANTRMVEITVVATRSGGKPVTDLRADELFLFDNKKPQSIAIFEKLGSDDSDNSGPNARSHRRWLSIIVLDALNTDWSAQIYGRKAVSQIIEKLSPDNRVAIFALGDGLRLLHDFSSDMPSLRAAIDRYHGEQPFLGADKVAPANPLAAQLPADEIAHRTAPDPDPSAGFYQERRIFTTLDSLVAIARIMKNAPGKKNLLWVSAAFPLTSHHQDVSGAMRKLTSAGLVLYAIDPRGVVLSSAAEANDDTMKELTEQTGGRTFYNDNDVASLVRAALDDSREGYVLTYKPRDYREDGSFHTVRLRTTRKGVELRYRPGYFADSSQR